MGFTVFMTAAYDHDAYGNAAKHLHFGNSVSYLGQRLVVTSCHACLIYVREEFEISELCEFWNVKTPLCMGLLQTIDEKHCFFFSSAFFSFASLEVFLYFYIWIIAVISTLLFLHRELSLRVHE